MRTSQVDLVILDTVTNFGAPFAAEKLLRRFQSAPEPAVVLLLSNTRHGIDLDPPSPPTLPDPSYHCLQVRRLLGAPHPGNWRPMIRIRG